MAISMSGATVDTSERDSLLSSSINGQIVAGGESANTSGAFGGMFGTEASGAKLAGVTFNFAGQVKMAINNYIREVQSKLDQLQAIENNSAFRGMAVNQALTTFVDSVREVGKEYLAKLQEAEKQIIESVDKAYSTQDTDLSDNLKSDSSQLTINQ